MRAGPAMRHKQMVLAMHWIQSPTSCTMSIVMLNYFLELLDVNIIRLRGTGDAMEQRSKKIPGQQHGTPSLAS
jgi:hypothetical protein